MDIEELYEVFLQSSGVTTDTRKIEKGQIYFALKGERFDGNTYALQAVDAGAILSVVDNEMYHIPGKTMLVENVLLTLQQLARHHRRHFHIPVIGITGSNGKTTTKELVHTVLKQQYNVLATIGNLNNHIGVPLTLLRMKAEHEIAIIEMGANHVHEIAELCEIAEPNHAIITSIGRAHIGEFGSFEAIKLTKAELYQWVAQHDGKAFINQNVAVLKEMAERSLVTKAIEYGDHAATYTYEFLGSNPFVQFKMNERNISTKLPGEYNYNNFITAATVGQYFKISDDAIQSALENYRSDNNRSQIVQMQNYTIIMDAYNANPSSMESALKNLQSMQAIKKGAILGHMLELGEYSRDEHTHIAHTAEALGLDFLCLVGKEFENIPTKSSTLKFRNAEEAKIWWKQQELKDFLVLIKGSRGIQLEKVISE